MVVPLVLSIFPGIDLLGRGFEAEGCCVVRGPDLLWGGDVRAFHPPVGVFDGVIGGPPCQDFSTARRCAATGEGLALFGEFARVVSEAAPAWWVMENVTGAPVLSVAGYGVQRVRLSARECGLTQHRLRVFQVGLRDSAGGVIVRRITVTGPSQRCCLASEGTRAGRRGYGDFCSAMGLQGPLELPGMTLAARYRAVGNGVPLPMARVIARSLLGAAASQGTRLCACGCGREVSERARSATAACRKRLERDRRRLTASLGSAMVPG